MVLVIIRIPDLVRHGVSRRIPDNANDSKNKNNFESQRTKRFDFIVISLLNVNG